MAAHQPPLSPGFFRQEHWSGLPFPSSMHESEKWKWSCSVMSDSLLPHGLQPTRFLCPWDFPGKSTGVGCHCLLHLRLHPWSSMPCKTVPLLWNQNTLKFLGRTWMHWQKCGMKQKIAVCYSWPGRTGTSDLSHQPARTCVWTRLPDSK